MEKTNDELIRELAKSMYDMPQSLCCSYCTKEKCITDKKGGLSHNSCVDCISDYWKAKVDQKIQEDIFLEIKEKKQCMQ